MSTQYIKAPYNFVPLSDEVVYPEWAEFISHDVPFEDGESGEITVKVKAHSPIYVRQGGEKKKEEKEKNPNFSQYNGKYFIPGSSIKGAVRNVLEIMTFSRMGRITPLDLEIARTKKLAFRDFHNSTLYDIKEITKNAKSGWLYKDEKGDYFIEKCGVPGRIKFQEVAKYFNKKHADFFTENKPGFGFDTKEEKHKSAKFKYDLFEKEGRLINVIVDPIANKPSGGKKNYDNRKKYKIINLASGENEVLIGNTKKGTIVFTGQPNSKKAYDFIFWPPVGKPEKVNECVIGDMKSAYFDYKTDKEQSIDWKYWKEKLEKKGEKIPVFFHEDSNDRIKSIGLSLLYKFSFEFTAADLIAKNQKEVFFDFSEALFGRIESEQEHSDLKGRVHISPAFALQETVRLENPKTEILSSPKASYYPNYIKQEFDKNGGKYKTFMDSDATLAGWKRYPIHKNGVKENAKPENAKEDTLTRFIPLQAGAEFEYKIRYHNLRKVELGALLSALTFHNTENTFHSIGMAKPLGYGKVTFELNLEQEKKELSEECMRAFEAYMEAKGINKWNQSDQICELITMASDPNSDAHLEYMKLDTKDNNEFTEAKKAREALGQYSNLNGISKRCANTLKVTPEDIDKATKDIKRWKDFTDNKKGKQQYLKDTEKTFEQQLELTKKEMLEKIQARKEHLLAEERKHKKIEAAKAAKEDGPSWDEIDLTHRDAFKNLKKAIELFVQKLNKGVNYDRLKKTSENPLLPEKFQGELQEKLQVIFGHLNSKGKKSWKKENNADQKKVAEWVGDKKAADYFNQL